MDGSVESVLMERITDGQLLITQIRECVEFRDAKGLKTYILEHKLSDQSVFWELTSELTQYVTEDILDKNPNFFEACERCLSYLVRNGNPKEMILALLEQADSFNDDVKYRTLLKLVQATLLKLPSKRFHSLDIALETLSAHVKSLQVPQFADFEDEERQLLDTDINVHRIEDVVSAYLNFLTPFVEEVSLFKACRTGKNNPQVLTLKKHLLFLLEHPLAYLDLEYDRKEEKAKTTSRCLAERTLDLLVHVERNFHKYLELARCDGACVDDLEEAEDTDAMVRENEENERRLDGQKRSAFERDDNDKMENWKYVKSVPKLAQACLSYLMYVEHLGLNRLPTIYSQDFLLEFNLPFISLCLQRQEFLIVHKGLLLLNSFLDVLKLGSLSADVLDNSAYMTMTSDVLAIMIHCPARKLRQMCVQLLPVFVKCFSSEGQYKLLHMIIASCEHSGVQGFVTQILKEQISDNLQCELPKRFFIGNSLDKILKLLVKLPDGPATDLLENSDRIISVLNLLRFLIIRDKPNQNVTGIWTSFPRYETQFIDALRMGLDMSTAHYKLELTNLLEAKGDQRAIPEDLDFSVCVGGESLSAMPKGQRISVLQSALITFDMIESLMVRLLELRDQQMAAYARKSLWILSSRNVSHNQGQGETTNHQHNGDSIKTDQYEEEDHEMKQRILRAALAFVPQHGWSRKTLAAGAEMEGLPPVAHGMFPRGGAELVHYLYTRSNRQLADALAAEVEELYTQGAEKPQTRPFIAKAVQSRLRMLLPYIEHWPQAMAIQALPQNATESWSNLATLTDDIWYHVGDRSTDFNWYTKRASLAVVYKATEIFMIQDRSEDFTDTWGFLDRRLNNIAVFSKSVKSMEQLSSVMSEGFLGMFIVGRNILGLNSRHR